MNKKALLMILMSFSFLAYGCSTRTEKDSTIESTIKTSSSSSEIKKIKLSKEYLTGSWESTEEDWPMEISVYKNPKTEQFELEILEPKGMAGVFTTVSGHSSFYNEDKSIEYHFFLSIDNVLSMTKIVAQDDPKTPSAIRPWILEKRVGD